MSKIESLEYRIALFLRYGVFVAGALMMGGWVIELIHQNQGDPFAPFRNYEVIPLSVQLAQVWEAKAIGMLMSYAGLFTLISLPVIRVALTAILFLKQKERILAGIALLVLLCLIFSFTQGLEL